MYVLKHVLKELKPFMIKWYNNKCTTETIVYINESNLESMVEFCYALQWTSLCYVNWVTNYKHICNNLYFNRSLLTISI